MLKQVLTLTCILSVFAIALFTSAAYGAAPVAAPLETTAQERVYQGATMDTVEVYRMFTGREPKRTRVLRVPRGARLPAQVAQLGTLRELQGYTDSFYMQLAWARQHGALLLSTTRGALYAYEPWGQLTSIPNLRIIVYQTDKGQGDHVYVHEFSPGTKLIEIPKTRGKFARIRGSYKIDSRGIVS